jgi:hypothetical protein
MCNSIVYFRADQSPFIKPKSKARQSGCAKFYTCRGWWRSSKILRKATGLRATRYFLTKNFPNPNRTCTVFTPGFGTVSPAFEMCM